MIKDRKKVIIIGAGIAGLTAGIYALQNGLDPIILEKHNIPGGLCTGWYRKGFYIDGCTHWLNGTKKGTGLYDNWVNIGAFKDKEDIIQLDSWGTFEYEGKKVNFWCDLYKAEEEWIKIAPEDKHMIKKFFDLVRLYQKIELPLDAPISMMPVGKMTKFICRIIPVLDAFLFPMKVSNEWFVSKFKNPAIQNALKNVQPGGNNIYTLAYSYANISSGNGGIPKGGSLEMIKRIVSRYENLGGTLKLNTKVKTILVNKKKAIGVRLSDNTEIYGDYVISACDVNFTLSKLLHNKYSVDNFDKRFYHPEKNPAPSCVLIHYTIKDMPNIPIPYDFNCEPFKLCNDTITNIGLRSYVYDKEKFVSGDKTVVQVLLNQDWTTYEYWNELYKDKEAYNHKKAHIANLIMSRIIDKFPCLKDKIEVLDVCTPKTFERYTSTARGAFMSFLFSPKKFILNLSTKVKGIDNLYLAGQWVSSPGGLPLASSSGKFAIQRICRRENIKYLLLGDKKKEKAFNKI